MQPSQSVKVPSLEAQARQVGAALEKRKYLVLSVLTGLYGLGAALHANGKPFWYDEIITLIVANSRDLGTAWKAAAACDASPPLPHLLTHLCVRWLGDGEVAARIPAILGFWVFCLCMFRFTRRSVGIFYALAALLLPVATGAYSYAVEARAYGPELAFSGLALVAWQTAAGRKGRLPALTLLALSVAAAIACQYYAVLLYLPLGGAEAFREWRAKRIDWGIWSALAIGGVPLVWRLTLLLGAVRESSHFWAVPYPQQAFEFWTEGLSPALAILVLFLALLTLTILRPEKPDGGSEASAPFLAPHELLAGLLFLAIPAAGVAGALLVTHVFTFRYALIALVGFCLLLPMVAAYYFSGRSFPGFLLFAALTVGLVFQAIDFPRARNPYENEPLLHDALARGPVVIPDGQLFLQMWRYAPEPLKSRILYVTDSGAAVKYMGFDSLESGLRVLTPWSSVKVVEYRQFALPGREFTVYQNTLRPGWLIPKIAAEGASLKVVGYRAYRALIEARLKP